MNKFLMTVAALGITFSGMAQDKFVTSALTARNQKNLDEAKTDIDKAMESPETKDKPKTLYAKALIYTDLNQDPKFASIKPFKGAAQALIKLVEVKPDYEKEDVNSLLYYAAQNYFNDGVKSYYDDKNVSEANENIQQCIRIYELGGGKRFEKASFKKKFDTIAANCDLTLGRIAYAQHDSLETIKTLSKVVKNPITRVKDNYYILLDAYAALNIASNNKMGAEETEALKEARTLFPDDANIRNMEINCFNRNGKTKELVTKLEESAKNEPNNADVAFNLALVYQGLAAEKSADKTAKADMFSKAETAFGNAVRLAPENATFNYSFAALYFNRAYEYNQQMADITGSTQDDLNKADALKAKRDADFQKALPYMEKTYSILSAKESNLKPADAEIYHNVMVSMKQIYIVQNKMDKAKEMNMKIKALEGK